MKNSNLLRWIGGFLIWAKIITIKRTKDLNYFSLCALKKKCIHEFHNLSWITEINELSHDILIYWDAPVVIFFLNLTVKTSNENKIYNKLN